MRSDFASRGQARICSGSSPGRAAYDAAVQHNRPQIRPATVPPTVPLCVVFFVFTLVSRYFERQDHSFEVVSLFATLHSSTCPVSSKAGFYSGERDRVDQQETLVLSVKDRA